MSSDERTNGKTQAEIDDLVARRVARHKYGIVVVILGVIGFLATMGAMLVRESGVPGGLGMLGICFVMVAVGGGFVDPSKVTPGFWK